ncbi:hypothetical protein [Anaerococcus sp.]|uniref:hypothetical protein n=1 Tax=Anaerococcus sp. TaxID=1872515 RepID=UPI00280C04B3|nr:hypothetical protein [Anaerococcus sp.]MDU3176679.1 hypothetical protein [Anaerococcus sp.]
MREIVEVDTRSYKLCDGWYVEALHIKKQGIYQAYIYYDGLEHKTKKFLMSMGDYAREFDGFIVCVREVLKLTTNFLDEESKVKVEPIKDTFFPPYDIDDESDSDIPF